MTKDKFEKKTIPQRTELKVIGTVVYDELTNQFLVKVEEDDTVAEYCVNEILELALDRKIQIVADSIKEPSEDEKTEDEE